MQHACKITVLETKVFPELQEQYLADPKAGPCPCFKAGDTFVLERNGERDDFWHMLDGTSCPKRGTASAPAPAQPFRAALSYAAG